MESLKVKDCEILVGEGARRGVGERLAKLDVSRVFVIADINLRREASAILKELRAKKLTASLFYVKAVESSKSLRFAEKVYTEMINEGLDRKSFVLAVGGGVVGDLAGFVAGTFSRGIRWGSLPSTLLAQVDSSVGGKTGLNHALGKNLIGIFHHPTFVLCDTDFLETLSKRDRVSGLGEIAKYGLLFDPRLFFEVTSGSSDMNSLITRSLRWKIKIVLEDEKETLGRRKLLNFGHTVGHALETLTDYRKFRHGEAVIWGMRVAAHLSHQKDYLAMESLGEIEKGLTTFKVPVVPKVSLGKLLKCLARDKKTENGKTSFVLLEDIAKPVFDNEVGTTELLKSFQALGIKVNR